MIKIQAEEKDIEDILQDYCKEMLGLRFIARQIKTPAGIIDIIARCPETKAYYIIELKKDKLDAYAFCQVMRYAYYLNNDEGINKQGKRFFVPLLIGARISDELIKCVNLYEHGDVSYDRIYRPEYTLFNLDPFKGIRFDYHDSRQKKYQDDNNSYCDVNTFTQESYQIENFDYYIRDSRLQSYINDNFNLSEIKTLLENVGNND